VPYFAAFVSESQFVVPTQDPNALTLVDAASGAIVRELGYSNAECHNPSEARATPDGRVYLVCEGDHYTPGAVVEIDPATLGVKARASVGLYPERLAILEP
jgi:hypothetical protein